MAGNKIFLDTNIILDFVLTREGELHDIEQIFNLANRRVCDCFISETVISTSLYFLEKERMDSMQVLKELCIILKILPFHLNVLQASFELFKDKDDGLLYFIAQHYKMDFFITRNIRDFKKAPVSLPVLTPNQFIKHLHLYDLPQ